MTTKAASRATVGDHCIVVHTGNGQGSINTAIDRFTTAMTSTGTAITYADSATLGASFTINQAGLYEVFYQCLNGNPNAEFGISLNSAALTTRMSLIPVATRVAWTVGDTTWPQIAARTVKLAVGDVIRPHNYPTIGPGTTDKTLFSIRKVNTQ